HISTLSLHDALPISREHSIAVVVSDAGAWPRTSDTEGTHAVDVEPGVADAAAGGATDGGGALRGSQVGRREGPGRAGHGLPRHRSEEHTSELQSPYD